MRKPRPIFRSSRLRRLRERRLPHFRLMHYHYHPQEPDDTRMAFCAEHIPEDERWLTYLCDCEGHNVCVVCEEAREADEANMDLHIQTYHAGAAPPDCTHECCDCE
jgi:hypothetical protein